jgi:hypothetical protein
MERSYKLLLEIFQGFDFAPVLPFAAQTIAYRQWI